MIHRRRSNFSLLRQFLVEAEDASVGRGGVVHVSYAAAAGGVVWGGFVRGVRLVGGGMLVRGVFDGGGGEGAGVVADAAAAEGRAGGGRFVEGVGHLGV